MGPIEMEVSVSSQGIGFLSISGHLYSGNADFLANGWHIGSRGSGAKWL